MVVNRLQNGLINSSISPWASRINCQNIFFSNKITYFFLVILIEIFILKTTMYHKCTLKYQKFTKKKNVKKCYYRLFHFALNIGDIFAQSHMLLFVICFSSYLNLVITYNAMHFDSFSLDARHLFQKLVLFFLCEVILVIHCCFQN
jgi:hypothetical protein